MPPSAPQPDDHVFFKGGNTNHAAGIRGSRGADQHVGSGGPGSERSNRTANPGDNAGDNAGGNAACMSRREVLELVEPFIARDAGDP